MDKLTCLISALVSFLIGFAFTYQAKADTCIIEDDPVQIGEPWYVWTVSNPYWDPRDKNFPRS